MWIKVLLAWVLAAVTLVAGTREWSSASNEHLYPAASELVQPEEEDWRPKRTGPSLSVSNPIEVLRNRLLLEIARRKIQKQGQQNREFLKNIGKRASLEKLFQDEFRTDDGMNYIMSHSGGWERTK